TLTLTLTHTHTLTLTHTRTLTHTHTHTHTHTRQHTHAHTHSHTHPHPHTHTHTHTHIPTCVLSLKAELHQSSDVSANLLYTSRCLPWQHTNPFDVFFSCQFPFLMKNNLISAPQHHSVTERFTAVSEIFLAY